MHQAPNEEQKYLFLKQERLKVYFFGLLSTICVVLGNLLFIYAFPFFVPYVLATGITIFYLSLSYLVGFLGKEFDFASHMDLIGDWEVEAREASVDIYLPVCNEPIHVIFNTWEFVAALAKWHPNAKVFVLDDGDLSQATLLREEAARLGFGYIRRETNELKKAGNLRHAFAQTSSDYIAIFDADFCPRTDFLRQTIPYLLADDRVSIVQTPQFFDVLPEYGWVRRGAGAVQELFYRLIQVNRDTFNGAICVGTNAVYRRSHLAPFGGTAPIPYSEDVHTGFQLIKTGHTIRYLPVNLALGACPDTAQQFFTQQYRWALGSISLMCSRDFWTADITVMQRICYMTGMFYYVSTGIGAVTYFLPSLFVLAFFPQHMHWYNLLFSVPSLIFSIVFMKHWMIHPMGVDVLRVRALSYFAHLFALKDRLFDNLEEWKPTGASTKSGKFDSAAVAFSFTALGVPATTAVLIAWRIFEGYPPENFLLLAAFTVFNAWVMIPVVDDL